jgi:hypothetical protein
MVKTVNYGTKKKKIVSLEFFVDVIRPHYGPEVDSASNRNEHQEYFLGVKAAWVRVDNLATIM